MLPYFLGCPSWNEPAWRGSLYPPGLASRDFLPAYCRVFNAVEGNTTFYARPAAATLARWAQLMPEGFHFCAKLPRDIFDYVWIIRPPAYDRRLERGLIPVWRDGTSALFRIDHSVEAAETMPHDLPRPKPLSAVPEDQVTNSMSPE